MKRLAWVLLALLIALAGGAAVVWAAPDEVLGVATGDAEQAFDRELAAASAQGLTVVDRGESLEATVRRTVPVGASGCVALVVSVSGPSAIATSSLTLGASVASQPQPHHVAHHAVCTRTEGIATAAISISEERASYGPSTVRWALLVGPVPRDPSAYPRLSIDEALGSALAADAVRARATALLGPAPVMLRETTEVPPDAAWMVPVSTATQAARRATTGSTRRLPRVLRSPIDPPDALARPEERETDPFMHVAAGRLRLLLVLDAGALTGGCLRVVFADLADPVEPLAITRVSVPDLEEHVLPTPDPAVAIDELCPADGLFVYGTAQGGAGAVEISLVTSGDPIAPSGASAFAPTPLVLPVVRALRERCDAADAQACLELSRFASEGAAGAGDVEAILGPRCDAEGGSTCAMLAAALREANAPAERIDVLERRACATGDLPTCLRRAAVLRERGEMAGSLRLYQFACDRGEPSGCAASALFTEWSLAERGPSPTPEMLP